MGADFRTIERESLEALRETVNGVSALDRIARAWITDPASLADAAQAARASSAFTRRGPMQFSATYRELVSAGELGLLKSEPLRRALSAYERNDRIFFLASSTLATEVNAVILPPLSSTMEVLATVHGDATARDVAALSDQIRVLAQAPGTLAELMAWREALRTHFIFHQRTLQSARDLLTLLGVDPSEEVAPDFPGWAAREEGSP